MASHEDPEARKLQEPLAQEFVESNCSSMFLFLIHLLMFEDPDSRHQDLYTLTQTIPHKSRNQEQPN